MNDPISYSANDIERYHNGQMTVAERHLLEKAALDDPALADMLEGYAYTKTPVADLQALQQRLQQRVAQKKEGGRVIFSMQWLKVAAVFLFVAAGGWLAYQSFSGKADPVAASPESATAKTGTNTPALPMDSVAIAKALLPEPATDTIAPQRDIAMQSRKRSITIPQQPQESITAPMGREAIQSKIKQAEEIAGYTQPSLKEDSVATTMALRDETALTNRKTLHDTIKIKDVVLEPQESGLSEVVVTGYGASRNAKMKKYSAADTIEPVGGWPLFEKYIAENLKLPGERYEKKASENFVELSFDVDKKGNPVHIKVTSSLCKECDAEAIRLLKEGPKWKGKRGRVKIPLAP